MAEQKHDMKVDVYKAYEGGYPEYLEQMKRLEQRMNPMNINIDEMLLSVRAYNSLYRAELLDSDSIYDCLKTNGTLRTINNIGRGVELEILAKLDSIGYDLSFLKNSILKTIRSGKINRRTLSGKHDVFNKLFEIRQIAWEMTGYMLIRNSIERVPDSKKQMFANSIDVLKAAVEYLEKWDMGGENNDATSG